MILYDKIPFLALPEHISKHVFFFYLFFGFHVLSMSFAVQDTKYTLPQIVVVVVVVVNTSSLLEYKDSAWPIAPSRQVPRTKESVPPHRKARSKYLTPSNVTRRYVSCKPSKQTK